MMGTKDAAGFLAPFKGLAAGIITVPLPRAHEPPHAPEALARAANGLGFASEPASDVDGALAVVRGRVHGPVRVLICICGSLYLAGALLASVQGLRPQSN